MVWFLVHLVALVKLRGNHSMYLEKLSMTAATAKLRALGGSGPLKAREWRIRVRLGWHNKAASAVRHLIYGERKPTVDELKQIDAAHLRYCAEKVTANARENEALFSSIRTALAAMEASDPDFFRPHIEAVGELLIQLGNRTDKSSDEKGEG
jgi:hypothetical protein